MIAKLCFSHLFDIDWGYFRNVCDAIPDHFAKLGKSGNARGGSYDFLLGFI